MTALERLKILGQEAVKAFHTYNKLPPCQREFAWNQYVHVRESYLSKRCVLKGIPYFPLMDTLISPSATVRAVHLQ